MNTKIILFLIFLISFSTQVNGQLTVNAGNDTTACMCRDTIRLGGNPTANGGKEPYTYKWELMPVYFYDYRILTSELLNDSTTSNPFIDCGIIVNDTVTLVLTVTDADFNSKTDSVKIIISSVSNVHVLYFSPEINLGDSVQLNPLNIYNGIAPFTYQWTPETGLSNPNVKNPYAKPGISTRYTCLVTDAIGCTAKDINDVVVIPTGISDLHKLKHSAIVFPNPVTSESQIKFSNPTKEKLNIKVVNSKGQLIINDWFNSDLYDIGKKINQSGNYIYRINNEKELLSTGTFLK
ncbi:MAG TPA: T9SS type A sorting domain-containing protein [Draconibacterium sp.]|nr:T9SS type A sorting domain-containing protein [Draconibacterium sp.]